MISLPEIKTPRLILRPLAASDAEGIYAYAKRDDVGPRAGWAPHRDINDTKDFIRHSLRKRKENQPGVFTVVHRAHDSIVGTIEIHSYIARFKGEIGMVLHPDYWGKELMVEASRAVMVFAFEHLGLKRLEYKHYVENTASKRLWQKLGFTEEGIARNGLRRFDGSIVDAVVAGYTESDYHERDLLLFHEFKKNITIRF